MKGWMLSSQRAHCLVNNHLNIQYFKRVGDILHVYISRLFCGYYWLMLGADPDKMRVEISTVPRMKSKASRVALSTPLDSQETRAFMYKQNKPELKLCK